jgi:branched-chain amino acid aminotransferase
MSLVWVNGTLVDKADARVSVFDHGLLYGDGVWEPLRVFGGRLFRPAEHVRLLAASAGILGITLPYTPDELIAAVEATARANHRTDGYCRVVVTRGPGTIGPDPRKLDPQVFITAEEYQPFPLELYGHGLHVVQSSVQFTSPNHWWFFRRLLGQPHLVVAKREALERGCLDAVLVMDTGMIVGTTEGPLFFVTGSDIRLPNHYQPEASVGVVKEIAARLGFGFLEVPAGMPQLAAADEAFLAGTACGVVAVTRVNFRDIAGGTEGPVTRAVREAYRDLTSGADTILSEGGAP